MFLLLAGLALADVAPSPSDDPGCEVALLERKGLTCEACDVGTGAAAACENKLVSEGYTLNCRTGVSMDGARWRDVWCRPRRPEDDAAASEEPPSKICAVAAGGGGGWALAALLAAGRRRCRRG